MADVAALRLPGVSGQYASAPDSAALSITGDIDIRVRVALADWTPASIHYVASKYVGSNGQKEWLVSVAGGSTGKFQLEGSVNGTTLVTLAASSVGNSFADGAVGWVRVTRVAATGVTTFYTSTDSTNDPASVSWTQLGTTVTSTTGGLFDGTAPLNTPGFGGGTGQSTAQTLYRLQLRNGIGGTVAFDADFSSVNPTAIRTPASFTESSSNAATVTINGNAGWVWTAPTALSLPGVSGQYASAPDSAALDITGDIDVQVQAAAVDWTPAALFTLAGKWNTSTNNRSYRLIVNTDGTLALQTSNDGTAVVVNTSTAATGLTDGSTKWVRATLKVNDGGGNRVCKFYLSDDGTSWSLLGSTVTTAGVTTIFSGSSIFEVGATTVGTQGFGAFSVYRVRVLNGYDGAGTVKLDANFAAVTVTDPRTPTSFTESSSNAATVTLNGNAGWFWSTTRAVTFAATLGGLSSTITATVEHPATFDAPLGALVAAIAATPEHPAVLAAPLGSLTASATATPDHPATLTAPLGGLGASIASTVEHPAVLAAALGGMSAAITAVPEHPAILNSDLGALTASVTAIIEHPAAFAAPLGGLTATVNASVEHPATFTADLGPLTATLAATVQHPATLDATLGGLVASVTATVEHPAALDAPLGALSANITATSEHGTVLDAPLGSLAAAMSAGVQHPASLAADLGPLTATATATVEHPATFTAPFGPLVATAPFTISHQAIADAQLGGLTAAITAIVERPAVFDAQLGPLTGQLTVVPLIADRNPQHIIYTEPAFAITHQEASSVTHRESPARIAHTEPSSHVAHREHAAVTYQEA